MLVTMKELLDKAKEGHYAVGAFNVPNLESVMAVIDAAEELQVPVILQHAQSHEGFISLDIIGPIILDFAKRASVPVCVHLDHGADFDFCMRAIRMGFTSVMYDASTKSFEDNVRETAEVVRVAHAVGVSVEAELGAMFNSVIGSSEGSSKKTLADFDSEDDVYTNPAQAKEFVERTGVDALAIAFGTVHGVYVKPPVLSLDRITKVKEAIDIPFVMHGGSGVSDEDFHKAIANGICKVNYYTYSAIAGGAAVGEHVKNTDPGKLFYHDITAAAYRGIREDVTKAMKVFCAPLLK